MLGGVLFGEPSSMIKVGLYYSMPSLLSPFVLRRCAVRSDGSRLDIVCYRAAQGALRAKQDPEALLVCLKKGFLSAERSQP